MLAVTGSPLTDAEQAHLYEAAFDRTKRYSNSFRFYEPIEVMDPSAFVQFIYPVYRGQQVLFQDAACATPVTTVGDLVGGVKDSAGNIILTQTYDLKRPSWDGPDVGITFDGEDTYLDATEAYISGQSSFFVSHGPLDFSIGGFAFFLEGGTDDDAVALIARETDALYTQVKKDGTLETVALTDGEFATAGVVGGRVGNDYSTATAVGPTGAESSDDGDAFVGVNSGNLTVGRRRSSADKQLNGSLRWIAIWDRLTTPEEEQILRDNP